MTYTAPLKDMMFVLEDLCDLNGIAQLPGLEEATPDMVAAILEEAGKYAAQVLAPMNRVGDLKGLGFADGNVTTPEEWKPAYQTLVEMGWNSPSADPEHGGMGLPQVVNACIQEMFQGANMAFQLCPMLTQGAIEAIEGYANDDLKHAYLPKLVTGEWTGTMNLTEPQAGSDLAAVRSKAEPQGDHYLVSGQKIFITYGDHDLTENIIHLVLARLPDAPAGVKGISLFVVPKFMVNADGSLGARNDVRCVSIEHKLGIHGSPTCTLSFGDDGGAIGYLVGEPNRGLEYMFTMMNNARLNVGIQGIGVSEAATQQAAAYALDRKQGRTALDDSDAIIGHPDVRRMLAVMRARTDAARGIACRAARSLDYALRAEDETLRAAHQRRVDLLIPVVKGWSTESAIDTTSLGVQVHGGMGYVEETGAAQHFRDARITTIYEGTTGIQSLDLVGRKIQRDKGQAARELVADMRASAAALSGGMQAMVTAAADLVEQTVDWITNAEDPRIAQASSANILEMFGICLGAWIMGDAARAAQQRIDGGDSSPYLAAKLRSAQVYATHVLPRAAACHETAVSGTAAIMSLPVSDFQDER